MEIATGVTPNEEVDGEIGEVNELEQLLPGELAARRLDAAADQVVDDRLHRKSALSHGETLALHLIWGVFDSTLDHTLNSTSISLAVLQGSQS